MGFVFGGGGSFEDMMRRLKDGLRVTDPVPPGPGSSYDTAGIPGGGSGYGGFDRGSSFENPPKAPGTDTFFAPDPNAGPNPDAGWWPGKGLPGDTGPGGLGTTGPGADSWMSSAPGTAVRVDPYRGPAPSPTGSWHPFGNAPGSGTGADNVDENDASSVFTSIYKKYGLDPNNPTGLKSPLANIDYFLNRMKQTGGWTPGNASYWKDRLAKEIELAQRGEGNRQETGSGGSGANVFTDPATSEWESMLRGIVGKLGIPYTPEDWAPMLEQLRGYNKELQGPAYTPNEMDLMQTQAIDPLMASRDAMRQQTLQRLASRGIDPNSGVAQELLSNVDRGFAGQEAQTRSGFAAQGIERMAQNKGRAAQLSMLLPQLERGQFQSNEGRALQGLNLFRQIPDLADKRLGLAGQSLQSPNSMMGLYGLLAQLAQQQGQYNQNRQGDFWQMLAQLIPGLFR